MVDGLSRMDEEAVLCIMIFPNPNWWELVVELHETNTEIAGLKKKVEAVEVGKQ